MAMCSVVEASASNREDSMALSLFALIIGSVALNAMAQVLLRKAMLSVGAMQPGTSTVHYALSVATEPWLIAGMLCYAVSILIWLLVLSKTEVSVAYPFLSVGYVIAAALGFFFLGENVTPARVLGIALICSGLVFVARSA
jgi:multidrug transporter EmrE-like cation transporter